MKKTILFVALFVAAFAVRAQKCVVLSFQVGDNVTVEEVEAVSYEFRSTFNPSCYIVEEKFKVNRVLNDLGFNASSMKKEQIRKLGREMIATVVVYGSLSKFMDEYTLDVNVMDVSTGTTCVNQNNTFQKSEYRTHTRSVSQGVASKLCNSSSGGSTGVSDSGSGSGSTTAAKPTVPTGYTDLGLPSGTLWKNFNATGFYTYDEAVSQFGNRLPTKVQWEELKAECQWSWTGSGYKVTGPNGNSIVLPASGDCGCTGGVDFVGENGYYWSSTPKGSEYAWGFYFRSDVVCIDGCGHCWGRSVRLVQDN